jgi:hypothetical protein
LTTPRDIPYFCPCLRSVLTSDLKKLIVQWSIEESPQLFTDVFQSLHFPNVAIPAEVEIHAAGRCPID